eukprot:1136787-Pelagomonas_calceolata.AAC.5
MHEQTFPETQISTRGAKQVAMVLDEIIMVAQLHLRKEYKREHARQCSRPVASLCNFPTLLAPWPVPAPRGP